MLNVQIDQKSLAKAYKLLRHIPGAFPRAVAAALNRSLDSMKTDTVRETQEKYFIKPSDIRKTLTPKRASGGNLQAIMISKGGHRKLSQYQLTPKTPQAGRKNGFKGAVKRDGGLKPLPNAFMLDTPTAGYVLFTRIGSGRAWRNIKHVHAPSIPQIIKNKETVEVVQTRAQQVFEKRLNHEVMRLLTLVP